MCKTFMNTVNSFSSLHGANFFIMIISGQDSGTASTFISRTGKMTIHGDTLFSTLNQLDAKKENIFFFLVNFISVVLLPLFFLVDPLLLFKHAGNSTMSCQRNGVYYTGTE